MLRRRPLARMAVRTTVVAGTAAAVGAHAANKANAANAEASEAGYQQGWRMRRPHSLPHPPLHLPRRPRQIPSPSSRSSRRSATPECSATRSSKLRRHASSPEPLETARNRAAPPIRRTEGIHCS